MSHSQMLFPNRWSSIRVGLLVVMLAVSSASAQLRLTEFMASNSSILADEDGAFEDWIEVQNVSSTNVNLLDWSLTDDDDELDKWKFPAVDLAPGQFLVVFASDKDRRTPGLQLHTNFKLGADGEYLALVRPDGGIVTEFTLKYPTQYPNISYGAGTYTASSTLVASNAPARVRVPTDASLDAAWTATDFEDQDWLAGTNGVGYETGIADPPQVSFTPYLNTSIQGTMYNSNPSAYVRIPFVVADPSVVETLTLQMRYDDGFVAYLNGQEITRQNAADPLAWDSIATTTHSDPAAVLWEDFDVSAARFFLQTGTNVLALHGLNLSANNPDFLVQAGLRETHTDANGSVMRYFTQPSPGAPNGFGATDLGPIFLGVGHSPAMPLPGQSLVVTARVTQAIQPVAGVTMNYRVMYGAEAPVAMNDSGTSGDVTAGDGTWSGTIPGGLLSAGRMVRYYLTATDTLSQASRWPIFPDPNDSEEYLGTVVTDAAIATQLPAVHFFAADFTPVFDGGSARGALYHLGEFYDNILISRHGQSSGGWPKKSFNLDFNSDHRFLYQTGKPRQKDIKLLSNYGDKTRMHTTLTYEKIAEAGGAAHFSFQVRVQTNGAFYGIEDFVEDADELFVERLGRDPNGALYKMYNALTGAGGNEKKTRKWDSTADLTDLVNNLNESLPIADRVRYAYDHLDLPQTVSYFATLALVSSQDHGHKNYYLYHDNDGTDEWAILPWDVDLTWGRNWLDSGGYFQDTLFVNNVLSFYPGAAVQGKTANRFYNLIMNHPDFRAMYLRRLRTVMDTMLMPPGTPTNALNIEPRMRALANLLDPPAIGASDADLDFNKWGPTWGNVSYSVMRTEVERTISTYVAGRRGFLYTNPAATLNGDVIPATQSSNSIITIASWDYNPASGNQDEEYVELYNANAFAVDVSGWGLDGGVHFTIKSGTIIPAGKSLYLSPNVKSFRARTTGPRGGQNLYVTGPYDGHLNAWGESLTLVNAQGALVAGNSFVGNPSAAQRYLRVTEIMYNPSPATTITNDAQQFEFIELKNISTNLTLNLTGVRFTNGIYFNFTGSAVTSLTPGQTVLLVRNQAMFTARYGGGFSIAGQFTGALDNGGETLRLEDAVGEKILEFDYNDEWYPLTDGLGFSLVIVDASAAWDTWDKKSSWRASGALNGSPGATDPAPPVFAPVIVNEVLTHTDLPALDSIELQNPTTNAVNIGGWFLTDDFFVPKKYRIANGTTIPAKSYLVFNENQFNTGTNAFRFNEYGEFVYLFSGDANTNLTGYVQGYEFGESPNGVSFGRYTNSQAEVYFVLQSADTLGTNNAYPRVGPIVISEFMYRPPDTNGADNDLEEFIELQNIVATNVPLYDPGATTNTWRLRNAVDFDFPTNQTLATGARLLVVGFNPTNTAQLAAFRAKYGVSNSVAVYGPWSGKLDNSSETIELKQPDLPDGATGFVPFIMMDKVAYRDVVPWPAGADGIGNSLQRVSNSGFGNDPTNWFAAGTTVGRATVVNVAPVVSILSPAPGAVINSSNVTVSVLANDSDGVVTLVQLLANNSVIGQWTATSSNFVWMAVPTGTYALRARVTDNLGAVGVSTNVTISVVGPPPVVAITSPTNNTVLVSGSAVAFSATAMSGSGNAASVSYFVDGNLIGSVGAPFILLWTANPPGYHSLTAIAYDAQGQTSAVAVAFFVQAVAANPVLIPSGAVWRYLDNGVDQGTAWIQPAFVDTGWSSSAAKFGFNGSGNAGITTVLNYGGNPANKYPTYYFRREFVVAALTGMTNLLLEVQRDDGVALYLNGVDLYRDNLPAGTLAYSLLATNASDNGNTWQTATLPLTGLVVGTNRLAAEVHQSSLSSSDAGFDLRLSLLGYNLGPAFLSQPTNLTVAAGSNATFAVNATGSTPLIYRWYFNNTLQSGGTNALTVTNVQSGNVGNYYAVVSNAVGVVTSSVVTLALAAADTDGDGMPDAWESANGTNPGVHDANSDSDADGMINLNEYWAGTSPTNAASALRFNSVLRSGSNLIFSFTAVSNRGYTIQSQSVLAGSWQKWQDIGAVVSNRTLWLTNATGSTNKFYRLVTPQQP